MGKRSHFPAPNAMHILVRNLQILFIAFLFDPDCFVDRGASRVRKILEVLMNLWYFFYFPKISNLSNLSQKFQIKPTIFFSFYFGSNPFVKIEFLKISCVSSHQKMVTQNKPRPLNFKYPEKTGHPKLWAPGTNLSGTNSWTLEGQSIGFCNFVDSYFFFYRTHLWAWNFKIIDGINVSFKSIIPRDTEWVV